LFFSLYPSKGTCVGFARAECIHGIGNNISHITTVPVSTVLLVWS
jgi:hypothetical protein